MKIKRDNLESASNSGSGFQFELSKSPDAAFHIIEILTRNLYTNPHRSAIREVLGNAIDASIEGNNKRVDIYITESDIVDNIHFLEIKDYGPGIDEDRMNNYVRKIGNSTKRDSNEQIGALGIGICTLFCVGEQVYIETYPENTNKKITYLLYKDSTGTPCYDIKNITENLDGEIGTRIKVVIDDRETLDKTIKYVVENCFLIEVDLYTNLQSLIVLSSWVERFKYNKERLNKELKYSRSFYVFPIRISNNSYRSNTYYRSTRFESKGGYIPATNNYISLEDENRATNNKIFSKEIRHYKSLCNSPEFDIFYSDLIERLTSTGKGIIEEESIIVMMGDSLYTLSINKLNQLYKSVEYNQVSKTKDSSNLEALSYKQDNPSQYAPFNDMDSRVIDTIQLMYRNSLQLAIRVPIGSIRFSSNRENIVIEDKETRDYILKTLNEAISKYINNFLESNNLNKDIDNFKDLAHLYKSINSHNYLFNIRTVVIPSLRTKVLLDYNNSYYRYSDTNNDNPWVYSPKLDKYENKLGSNIIFSNENKSNEITKEFGLISFNDISNNLIDYLDSYIVGPTSSLKLNQAIESNLSDTMPTNKYTKQKISRVLGKDIRHNMKAEIITELFITNNIKIILSNITSIKDIRSNSNIVQEEEPFILIVERESSKSRELRNSLAYKLLDVKFYTSKRTAQKKEITVQEKEYKSFNDSLKSTRVLNVNECKRLLSDKDIPKYDLARRHDITEKVDETNLFKNNYLNKVIICEELNISYISANTIATYWLVDMLLRKGYIKGEENKLNRLIFLTPLSYEYLNNKGHELRDGYKLRNIRDVYKIFLYKLYKKNKEIIESILTLSCEDTIRNRYSYYNTSSAKPYLYSYCATGQIEKVLRNNRVKCNRSILKICLSELGKVILTEILGIKINEDEYRYREEEYSFLENILRIVIQDLIYLKIYNKREVVLEPIHWLLGYNSPNMSDRRLTGDYIDREKIDILDSSTGLLDKTMREIIESTIK